MITGIEGIGLILIISFFSNFFLYLIYRIFLKNRMDSLLGKIRAYEERVNEISSSKRRERISKKVSKEVEGYMSSLRSYVMMQSLFLVILYIIDLFIVFGYFYFNLSFPVYIPLFTIKSNSNIVIPGGSLWEFIASYFVFTSLSLRSNLKRF